MAEDVVAVLDAAGVDAAAVFGASMGGLVAQHLVVDHPARVADLILAATAPGGEDGVDPKPEDQAALLGKGARTPEDAYRMACTVLYSQQFQRTHPEFIEAQIRERALHPVRPRVFSAQFNAMWQPDNSFRRLAAVAVPTLVLHGTEDVVTPFENARKPQVNVKRSRVVIGRSAGTVSSSDASGARSTRRCASSGNRSSTGASSAKLPASMSASTAAAVIGFVIEVMRNKVSRVIDSAPTDLAPAVATWMLPPRATAATTPGASP